MAGRSRVARAERQTPVPMGPHDSVDESVQNVQNGPPPTFGSPPPGDPVGLMCGFHMVQHHQLKQRDRETCRDLPQNPGNSLFTDQPQELTNQNLLNAQ